MCVLIYVCAEMWKNGVELRVESTQCVCVCVWRGITEARNRDLAFIVFHPCPLSISPHSCCLLGGGNSRTEGEQTSSEPVVEAMSRGTGRRWGGQEEERTHYSLIRSVTQAGSTCQRCCFLLVHTHLLPAFSAIYISFRWPLDLGLLACLHSFGVFASCTGITRTTNGICIK